MHTLRRLTLPLLLALAIAPIAGACSSGSSTKTLKAEPTTEAPAAVPAASPTTTGSATTGARSSTTAPATTGSGSGTTSSTATTGAPTSTTTATTPTAPCPDSATLTAAYRSASSPYGGPPSGAVTGFTTISCWGSWVVANPQTTTSGQGLVFFTRAGGAPRPIASASEAHALSSAVCSSADAPANWRGPDIAGCTSG